jgi:large subunit ribosomal protein L3
MAIGIIGRKCGMTRIFTPEGASIPVTVIEATPNRVTQIKSKEKEKYRAIQVTTGHRRAIRINKPEAGHLAKAGVETGRGFWEFRLDDNEGEDFKLGGDIKVDIFTVGQKVDVTGISKGKGFAGVVKRHNFKTQDASHGNSLSHRAPGSIGQNQTPGRVFKGKKMAGQMGNVRCTVQNLEVVRVDSERDLLIIKGAIPGAPGGDVIIRPAIKAMSQATK